MAAQTGAEPCAPNRATVDGPVVTKDRIKLSVEPDQSADLPPGGKSAMKRFIHNLLAGMAVWSV
jgi:hypothetical protein